MEIEFYTKNVYGKDLMYVSDPTKAAQISSLTRMKSLNENAKRTLEEMGFTFKEIIAPKKS